MTRSIRFTTNIERFANDFIDMIKAFSPVLQYDDEGEELRLDIERLRRDYYRFRLTFEDIVEYYYENPFKLELNITEEVKKRAMVKRYAKVALYRFLVRLTGKRLPYGSLTGIRPTKLFHDLTDSGVDAKDYFLNDLRVGAPKVETIARICANQQPIYRTALREVDVFVNIPICVSRCAYCSFISARLDQVRDQVEPYCDLLCRELEGTREIVDRYGLTVRAVYVGGGTPTSLDAAQLDRVLASCRFDCKEFTVEAGRPDTITRQKFEVMARRGVTRVSINPQTFCQATLDAIGRRHTVDDVYRAYEQARALGFDINTDLIAMLPGEDECVFARSVDCAIALDPQNITVHTLALKRGSALKTQGYENAALEMPRRMIDYSSRALAKAGYEPYYLYKQKYMSGSLENIGYCKPGKPCIYNVDIMEETTTIIANGAGGISKTVDKARDTIERLANPKGLDVYLSRGSENLARKEAFFREFFLADRRPVG